MSTQITHVIDTLDEERKKLRKENERLQNQIDTCEDMLHNYNIKVIKNNDIIKSINDTINML